jgi:hypothetical protein
MQCISFSSVANSTSSQVSPISRPLSATCPSSLSTSISSASGGTASITSTCACASAWLRPRGSSGGSPVTSHVRPCNDMRWSPSPRTSMTFCLSQGATPWNRLWSMRIGSDSSRTLMLLRMPRNTVSSQGATTFVENCGAVDREVCNNRHSPLRHRPPSTVAVGCSTMSS